MRWLLDKFTDTLSYVYLSVIADMIGLFLGKALY